MCKGHHGAKKKVLLHLETLGNPPFPGSIPSEYSFIFPSSSTYLQTVQEIICNDQFRYLGSQQTAPWCTRTKTSPRKSTQRQLQNAQEGCSKICRNWNSLLGFKQNVSHEWIYTTTSGETSCNFWFMIGNRVEGKKKCKYIYIQD